MTTVQPFNQSCNSTNDTSMNTPTIYYKICDEIILQAHLDQANDDEGFVTMEMVKEVLPLFVCNDVLRVRGDLHSTTDVPPEFRMVTEVILIQHHGLVVGEVLRISVAEALLTTIPPSLGEVEALFPDLVEHLEYVILYLPLRYTDPYYDQF